jgi:hypothetical protein
VPTRRNGVFGQWCVISGTHCKEEKYLKNTSNFSSTQIDVRLYYSQETHLLFDVFKRCRRYDRKTHKKDIGLRIGKRS